MFGIFSFFFLFESYQAKETVRNIKKKGKRSSGKRRRKSEHKAALLPKPHENVCFHGTETHVNQRLMKKFWMEIFEKSAVESVF